MSEVTDAEIVRRVLSGERDAFADLIRRHHAAIIGLCVSMLHDPSEAEDAAQESFLKAYRSLERFRADSAFSTWVYRIASNHCLDLLRRRAREKSESLEAFEQREGERVRELFAAKPDSTVSIEDADLLERVMAELPDDYRLILTMREVQGLNYKELANALDCTLDAVKARLKRARQKLDQITRHFSSPADV